MPDSNKQDGVGRRHYTGFNKRWKASHPEHPTTIEVRGAEVARLVDGLEHDTSALICPHAPPVVTLLHGDVIEQLRSMEAGKVSCVVTSPPYFNLRSYGIAPRRWDDGEECVLGEEKTLDSYIIHLVEVFREVKRILHPRGSAWLNLADCYAGGGRHIERKEIYNIPDTAKPNRPRQKRFSGKDLLMVPARAAIALQDDGWILRQDVVWAKAVSFLPCFSGSVMPESTRDRTTWAHEHVFHLTLREDYFYDQDGCREPYAISSQHQARDGYTGKGTKDYAGAKAQNPSDSKRRIIESIRAGGGRNLRNVWVIPKQNFTGWSGETSHFATFPERLIDPIVKLASSECGVCVNCASPVQRRTVREATPEHILQEYRAARIKTAEETGRTDGFVSKGRANYRRRILREEWEPSCQCNAGIIAATVLDIFAGSGRAGIAAVKLGRSFTGIDANAEYLRMAAAAIEAARS